MAEKTDICFLSGLEIPKGKYSREHYVPKSRTIPEIWSNPNNIFPSHKVINHIKSNFLPCEWESGKWSLTYRALHNWNLKNDDAEFVARTLLSWETYQIDPCEYCLIKCQKTR